MDKIAAINKYIETRSHLRHDDDFLNISNGEVIEWGMKNIPYPSDIDLTDCWIAAQADEDVNLKVKAGVELRKKCDMVRDFIGGLNHGNMNEEQVDMIEAQFAPVLTALINLRPEKARKLISAIDANTTVFSEHIKSKILEML